MTKEQAKKIVKTSLWQFGYKAQDVSGIGAGYDLLVAGKFHVTVLPASSGKLTGYFIPNDSTDILAVVLDDDKKRRCYAKRDRPDKIDGKEGWHFVNFTKKPGEAFK